MLSRERERGGGVWGEQMGGICRAICIDMGSVNLSLSHPESPHLPLSAQLSSAHLLLNGSTLFSFKLPCVCAGSIY